MAGHNGKEAALPGDERNCAPLAELARSRGNVGAGHVRCRERQHWKALINNPHWSVPHLGGAERLSLDCTGFLELQRSLLGAAETVAAAKNEHLLRRPEHFQSVVGRRVALKTSEGIQGRKNFRGPLKDAGERSVRVAVDGSDIDIPYEAIVRANLISESR